MKRLFLAALLGLTAIGRSPALDSPWVTAWTAPPDQAGSPMGPQSLRQILRVSVGGTKVRIRLSNLFGQAPLRIASTRVALSAGGSSIQPGSDQAVTFQGAHEVLIPPGQSALSDAVAMHVTPNQALAVSLHLPETVAAPTLHGVGLATAYLAPGKDITSALKFPHGTTDDSRYFLTDVEVEGLDVPRALVAFGDSITDGVGSAMDGNGRWTDLLRARLQKEPGLASVSVVNAGIAGNRILRDGADPFVGPSGLSRFERDALSKPGVRWVLLLVGGNDISANGMLADANQHATAHEVIEGMKALVAQAHARGIRVWAGTLTPHGEAAKPFHETATCAAEREAVRQWIRTSGAFDAVIDFDRALRDPAHPDRMLPAYASSDHVHPNAAGYRAMAEAIDLRLFREGGLPQLKPLP